MDGTVEELAERVSFQLSYKQHRTKRRFHRQGIDGQVALDPHGEHEDQIYALAAEFTKKLWELREHGRQRS